jgi:hypothetical protein
MEASASEGGQLSAVRLWSTGVAVASCDTALIVAGRFVMSDMLGCGGVLADRAVSIAGDENDNPYKSKSQSAAAAAATACQR